jgi:general stress protein 26
MAEIPHDVKHLLDKHHVTIVASRDGKGIHTSAKGILEVDSKGKIFILDLYKNRTYRNIKRNPHVTLTTIDERAFKGYSVKGRAKIIKEGAVPKNKLEIWHAKLATRIARRLIRHVKGESAGHEGIPEARFPLPKYIIEVSAEKIVDLAPQKLKAK